MRVATGENRDDPKQIVPLLTCGAVDVLQPNLKALAKPPERQNAINFARRTGAGVLIHGENR